MEQTIYNQDGKSAGKIKLPESVFGLKWNADLVHQVVTSLLTNARTPIAHVKDRSEVSGGGRKPWKQKGTGRSRHGSTRSPIWVGGGKAHGPRNEKNFDRKVNKKMKVKALSIILSKKLKDGEILFVDKLDFKAPKAADGKKVLAKLAGVKGFDTLVSKRKNSAFIGDMEITPAVNKSFRNFKNIKIDDAKKLNVVDVLNYKYLVLTKPDMLVKFLEAKSEK